MFGCCFKPRNEVNIRHLILEVKVANTSQDRDECPICFEEGFAYIYQCKCCKKMICVTCAEQLMVAQGILALCPFCRSQPICRLYKATHGKVRSKA